MAPPQLGATFVPGGFDDYYMPEVVAPAPQRVTPQVPQNMQEDLQRMELEATSVEPRSDTEPGPRHAREPSLSTYINPKINSDAPPPQPPKVSDDDIRAYQTSDNRFDRLETMNWDAPSFSPFPKVKGDNIPPTDEEKEEILWNARKHVLHSQNVSMQITWARDVLTWSEIAQEAVARENVDKARPATPRIEHELRLDAINIITYLAQQEHPEALYMRSKWLEFGKFGNRVDKREAYGGYKRAADLGHGRSEYRMGMLYEQSNDMSKAKEHYYRGLSLKDSASLYRMGMMSLLGQHGESKDYSTGLERIQLAADSSDEDAPQGAYVYGMLVGRDLPDINVPDGLLPVNVQMAKMYIEKAAYLGFAKAQLKMGQAFELCQFGCDFNPSYSLHYYGLAAKQGLPEAALGVSRWFLFGYEGVFKKNESLAYKYAQEAAAAKLPTGEFALGYYNEIGIHVEKSVTEARKWYQLAADHGNKDALGRLDSLSQDKTLSKADHETTTLTRIKSQHGSQRGQRPDRFKQPQQMPTLSENSAPDSPVNEEPPILTAKPAPAKTSPRLTPNPGPGIQPTIVSEHVNFPDPSRASFVIPAGDRPPAFNVRLDINQPPVMRPQSAAPYPEDDRPPPLALRPKSTAPYPEDDVRGRGGPGRLNQGMRPGQGPAADRPASAFGIKPQTAGPRPMPTSQSMGNLHVQPPGRGPDPRGRVGSGGWDSQGGRGGYGKNPPGRGPASPTGPPGRPSPYPEDEGRIRPATAQPYPSQGPPGGGPGGPGRLQKQPPPGQFPPAGTYNNQPQRVGSPGYGPRTSSRPGSGGQPGNAPRQNYERFSQVPGAAGRPERLSSLPQQQQQQQQQGPSQPLPQQAHQPPRAPSAGPRPPLASGAGGPGRTESAPPHQSARPEGKPSPAPSANSAATVPAAKPPKGPAKQGPATFEDMGIPQGKQDGDCVVM
ncbi:Fc.00g012590.m01.CDS01 [Cosmosporella sp. VM-42]